MKEIKELKIEPNPNNGGICATFKVGEQEYWADLCDCAGFFNECMIFPAKDGKVTDWGKLYCNRDVSVCKSDLKRCIEDFVLMEL